MVEQDSDNYMRFDFYSDGTNLRIFAASFSDGVPAVRLNKTVVGLAPLYLRLNNVLLSVKPVDTLYR